jgi:hypothetical protein
MDLAEDHLLVRAMNGPPGADAPLQGAARAGGQIRMAPLHLLEHRNRAQPQRRCQHRHHLRGEEVDERIGAAATHRLPRRWQPVVLLEAIGGGRADRRLRGGHRQAVCLSECHVEPHLMIGDVAAGQWADPFTRDPSTAQPAAITTPAVPLEDFTPVVLPLAPPVGLRPPCAASGKTLSHLDCRAFSP